MPDRELPNELKARLSAELASGAPLTSGSPSQARYATEAPPTVARRRLRGSVLTLAVAALVVLVAASVAGPTQPREWLVRAVGNIAGQKEAPSPSPANEAGSTASPSASSHGSPAPAASPRQRESPVPEQTPRVDMSPEPTESPSDGDQSGGDGDHSSPSASPSPETGSGDGH